jgi:CheY-like chemotaxis protein
MTEVAGGSLRVLVVDNCPDTTATLTMLLELWGHEAHVAHTGTEALALAAEHAPHAVLLEVALRGLNGWELARRLRQSAATADSLLIMISSYTREGDRRKSLEAGCNLHLHKPADPMLLQQVLHQLQELRVPGQPIPCKSPPSPADNP